MTKAIFVFSADPITLGHLDIIRKASAMFEELIVGVGNNPDKKYLFTFQERVAMSKESLKGIANVRVEPSYGLTVDFALQNKASVIVRGVRTTADLDYELVYAQMTLSQKTGLQTIFIPADPKLIHVSSSVVKSIQKDHGLIMDFVPYNVKAKLEEKMNHQYFVSITGAISAGKTTFSNEITHYARNMGVESHNIEMDKIGHLILSNHKDPYYRHVREEVVATFGKEIQNADSSIDRKKLASLVFDNEVNLAKLEALIYEPIRIEMNRQTRNLQGLVFITAALIVEKNLLFRSNNNIILVDAQEDIRIKRLLAAGFTEEEARNRMRSQWPYPNKVKFIEKKIREAGYGTLMEVNTDAGYSEENLKMVWNKICQIFNNFEAEREKPGVF